VLSQPTAGKARPAFWSFRKHGLNGISWTAFSVASGISEMKNSTRRFNARPSSVLLVVTVRRCNHEGHAGPARKKNASPVAALPELLSPDGRGSNNTGLIR
jgi:hypothetical protein